MFIYSFKSKGAYLIKHIVISGNHLTLYTSQKYCGAIQSLITNLNLKDNVMSGDHPAHIFLHNPFVEFSRLGDSVAHKHLKFPDGDILAHFKRTLIYLLDRQNSSELRKQDYDKLVCGLNKEREEYGHEKFPFYIEETLRQYDFTTPFFPQEEMENLVSELNKYLHSNNISLYAAQVGEYAETILNKNWNLLYYNKVANFETKLSQEDEQLDRFYGYLIDLRIALLGLHHEKIEKWYDLASNAIFHIRNNAYFKKTKSTDSNTEKFGCKLDEISIEIERVIQNITRKALFILSAGIAVLDLLRVDDSNTYFRDVMSVAASCMIVNYAHKPIRKASNYLYRFFNVEHSNNQKSEKTDLLIDLDKVPVVVKEPISTSLKLH